MDTNTLSEDLGCFDKLNGTCILYTSWTKCLGILLPPPPEHRPYRKAKDILFNVLPMVIVPVGVITNIITIVIILRSSRVLKASTLFLLSMAVADILFILNDLFATWSPSYFNIKIKAFHTVSCKLILFVAACSSQFSIWMLVAAMHERMFSVITPHRLVKSCSKRNSTGIVIAILLATLFVVNSHILFGYEVVSITDSLKVCRPIQGVYMSFTNIVQPWIDYIVFSLTPIAWLLITSVIILRHRYRPKVVDVSQMNNASEGGTKQITERSNFNFLFVLSGIFVFSQWPIMYALWSNVDRAEITKLECSQYIEFTAVTDARAFWMDFVYLLRFTKSWLSFFVYLGICPTFRRESWAMVRCKRPLSEKGAFGIST